jgi:hypothetical protein
MYPSKKCYYFRQLNSRPEQAYVTNYITSHRNMEIYPKTVAFFLYNFLSPIHVPLISLYKHLSYVKINL